jgi:pimeloyl-ACP methyl ester carboxylesterase
MRRFFSVRHLAVVLVLLGAAVPLWGQAHTGEPVVVFVHGRGQMGIPAATLRNQWYAAFNDGLQASGLAGMIAPHHRGFVYYADVYTLDYRPSSYCRPVARQAAGEEALQEERIGEEDAWAATDAERDPRWVSALDQVLTFATRRRGQFADGVVRAAAGNLFTDTRRYLDRRDRYCDTNLRLRQELQRHQQAGRAVILVGHSMGALVAMNLYSRAQVPSGPSGVAAFVSLGTQLGAGTFGASVLGTRQAPPLPTPASLLRWIHITGRLDYLGWEIGSAFDHPERRREVEIETIPSEPHAIAGYLRNVTAVRLIAREWCSAFRAPATAPAACNRVAAMP